MSRYIFLPLVFAAAVFASPISYDVTVDTSGAPASGYLDFQFNPGGIGSQSGFVTISLFQPSAGLSGSPATAGGVSGTLLTTLAIDNSTAYNDYFQAVNFGTQVSFLLALDGPAVQSPDGTSLQGSTFGFSIFESDQATPLFTSDPNGFAFTVDVNLDGTTTVTKAGGTFRSSKSHATEVSGSENWSCSDLLRKATPAEYNLGWSPAPPKDLAEYPYRSSRPLPSRWTGTGQG